MSRRVKRPLKAKGDRPKGAHPYRGSQAERGKAERPQGFRTGAKPARGAAAPLARLRRIAPMRS